MKVSVYSRSLIYAILLNFCFLILLKMAYSDVDLFTDSRIYIISALMIAITYLVLILMYKKVYSEVAKDAYRKSNQRFQEKSLEEARNKNVQLTLLKDQEKYRREFLGNVSHELKTPLFTIQSYILTLIDGAVKDKAIRTNYLSRINKSVDRLIYIVRDLDVLADIESGTFQMDFIPLDMEKLIREVFEFLELKAQESNVRLSLISELKEDSLARGNQERMEQVMTNLIANSIAYSNSDKAEVLVRLWEENDQIQVEVKDNGMGISEEHLPRIFERFYRVDSARSREKGGSGLGLAIVKNILESHGSEITIESTVGEGSRFRFALDKA